MGRLLCRWKGVGGKSARSENMITILYGGYHNALGATSVRIAEECEGSAGNEVSRGNLTFRGGVGGGGAVCEWCALGCPEGLADIFQESRGGGCEVEWKMSFTSVRSSMKMEGSHCPA